MKSTRHTLLIGFALTLLLGTGFLYFSHSFSSEAADPSTDSLSSSNTTDSTTGTVSDADISAKTAFLATFTSLTTIKIDTTLFTNPLFEDLHDNQVIINPVTPGRDNPFAPVDNASTDAATAALAPVVTNPASQIATTSAVLNGAINGTTPATNVYFEYGVTPTLGKTTQSVTQSLVSTFVTKISGLTTGTTYFYRADAKINGVLSFGDIISFTTN
jgi:hypothetical protein